MSAKTYRIVHEAEDGRVLKRSPIFANLADGPYYAGEMLCRVNLLEGDALRLVEVAKPRRLRKGVTK
jgi:hypothetical protein